MSSVFDRGGLNGYKSYCSFSTHDLLDESLACPPASIYGDFDIVFCCNLLYYYRLEIQRRILDKVLRSVAPGGYLVTGEAETAIVEQVVGIRPALRPAAIFQKNR